MATIKVIEERFKAIWLAACALVPIIPQIHIAEVKNPTSNNICRAEGNPK